MKPRIDLAQEPLIAIVDDDVSFREALVGLMRVGGYTAKAYASGPLVLDSGALDAVSLFLLDMQMPEMSGLDLHKQIRGLGHQQPVIFLTGMRDARVKAEAIALGARFMSKPFDPDELLACVQITLAGAV
jgi:FixJ family two-component response regulator